MRVLKRIVRLDDAGLNYEADPRQAEMLILDGGPELGKASVTPGAKPTDPDIDAVLEERDLDEVRPGDLDGELEQHRLEISQPPPHKPKDPRPVKVSQHDPLP